MMATSKVITSESVITEKKIDMTYPYMYPYLTKVLLKPIKFVFYIQILTKHHTKRYFFILKLFYSKI